ncbi:LabA-like NYN domain-containing protein [Agaribacter flavus]|uniref:NYN domain-containing protein n=1 Tax=Agaribacter flavus TaxID=1902781 RepID=A0ABV7FQH6_9ALTE
MKKIAIFVDVQNIYYTSRDKFNRPFNYRLFWQYCAEKYDIAFAYAYAIDKGNEQQQKFQSALRHIGFTVKLKPFIQRADGSAKGDWDVGITIDVLNTAALVDEVMLLSGDGDFAILLDEVKNKHECRTTVFGVRELSANSLINSADAFFEIDERWLL